MLCAEESSFSKTAAEATQADSPGKCVPRWRSMRSSGTGGTKQRDPAQCQALETLCAFLETLGSTFDKPQWSGYARLQEVFKQAGGAKPHPPTISISCYTSLSCLTSWQVETPRRGSTSWQVDLFANDSKQSPRTRCLLKDN